MRKTILLSFKGSCILKFWFSKSKEKLDCPLCRRDIKMLMINNSNPESIETIQSTNHHMITQNVEEYNKLFSEGPDNVL